jgi:ankyrin repeat protein
MNLLRFIKSEFKRDLLFKSISQLNIHQFEKVRKGIEIKIINQNFKSNPYEPVIFKHLVTKIPKNLEHNLIPNNLDYKLIIVKDKYDLYTRLVTKKLLTSIKMKKDNLVQITCLVKNKDDIDFALQNKLTPLMIAVMLNDLEKVKLLLSKGADIDATNKKSETPLMMALKYNRINLIRFFLLTKEKKSPDEILAIFYYMLYIISC